MTIGDLLRTAGVISPEQLQTALEHQARNGGSLAHALVALGFVSGEEIAKLVSRLSGVPWTDLEQHQIDPAVVRMIPGETARKYQVVPTALAAKVLTIAMADPRNVLAIDDIAFMTGCTVKPVVASESALKAAIDRYYGSTSTRLVLTTSETLAAEGSVAHTVPTGPSAEPAAPVFLHPPAWAARWLVAVNVVIFGLELLWGGSSSPLTLYRMGAGLGRVALAHQPWRTVSAAFLHINVVHLALNMWALVVFGRILEIMLGARRFVVLYGLSALGGGLASSLVHAQILSAGASGAVWGLMTAQIALLVRLKQLHGPKAVPVPTSTLMKPLVINLLFSLLPFVDMSAHLGGGAVGAALIFSGLMWGPRPSTAWRSAAWAASLAMASCVVIALVQGRPWQLRWPPPLVPRAIAGTPITVPVPDGLNPEPYDKLNVAFGDASRDPLALYCEPEPLDSPCPDPQRRSCLARTARDVAAKPPGKGWSQEQPPRVVQLRSRPAVSWTLRSPSGHRQMTWMFLEGSWWLRLDVFVHPDADASWAKLPAAIAEGVAFGPPSR